MKFLCPACDRLVELSDYKVDAGILVLRCDRCSTETRTAARSTGSTTIPETIRSAPSSHPNVVPLRPSAPEAVRLAVEAAAIDPFAVPLGFCLKCIARISATDTSCRQCGFTFGAGVPESAQPSATLSEDWRNVLSHWDKLELHDQMLQSATLRGDLAALGRLYRVRLAAVPDDPYAARGRDEVVRLAAAAAATLVPPRELPAEQPTALWKYLAVGAVAMGSIAAFIALVVQLVRG